VVIRLVTLLRAILEEERNNEKYCCKHALPINSEETIGYLGWVAQYQVPLGPKKVLLKNSLNQETKLKQ
jgi:hypothetical protein